MCRLSWFTGTYQLLVSKPQLSWRAPEASVTPPHHRQPPQSGTAGSLPQKAAFTVIVLPTLFSLEHALLSRC